MFCMEQFSEIKGFEGLYVASPDGRIFKFEDGKLGKQIGIPKTTSGQNYTTTALYDATGKKRNVLVHRIIAETFIPNPDNLEWCTYSENSRHALDSGLYQTDKVVKGREEFSFLRGWSQVKNFQMQQVKNEILDALGLKTRVSWYQRLYGNIEPRITEARAIEAVFAKYGIKDIWGV